MKIKFPDIKKLKNKKVFIGSGALIIIAGIVLIVRASTDSPNIATFKADIGEFIIDIRENGELKAAKFSSLASISVSKRLIRLLDAANRVLALPPTTCRIVGSSRRRSASFTSS